MAQSNEVFMTLPSVEDDFEPDDFEPELEVKKLEEPEKKPWYDYIFKAPEFVTNAATDLANKATGSAGKPQGGLLSALGAIPDIARNILQTPTYNPQTSSVASRGVGRLEQLSNAIKGFGAGAVEGLANRASPADIASILVPETKLAKPVIGALSGAQVLAGADEARKGDISQALSDVGFGLLGLRGLRGGKVPEAEVTPSVNQTITPSPVVTLPVATQPKLLPPIGGTTPTEPRFFAGTAGIADTKRIYPRSPEAPTNLMRAQETGATVLPREERALGNIGELSPIEAAQGTFINTTPHDNAMANPVFRALVPESVVPNLERKVLTSRPRNEITVPPPELEKNPELVHHAEYQVQQTGATPAVAKAVVEKAPNVAKTASTPEFKDLAKKLRKENRALRRKNRELEYQKPFERHESRQGALSQTVASTISPLEREADVQNPALGRMVRKAQFEKYSRIGEWTRLYKEAIKNVVKSKEKWQEFLKSVETGTPSQLEDVDDAVKKYQMLDGLISRDFVESGAKKVDQNGNLYKWTPIKNYWPHIYDKKVLQEMTERPTEFKMRMLGKYNKKTGKTYSPEEIDNMIASAKQYGDRLIDAQHERESELPGYRTDPNAYIQHLAEMAGQIAKAKVYGVRDLADVDSPVMNAIRDAKNPSYALDVMKSILDRASDPRASEKAGQIVTRGVTKLEAKTKLMLSGIANMSTSVNAAFHGNMRSYVKALGEWLTRDKQFQQLAQDSGSTAINVLHDLAGYTSAISPGMESGENMMRSISARTGDLYAQQLFTYLKKNYGKLNILAIQRSKQLERLLNEPIQSVMEQPSLTMNQRKQAAFSMQAITQGMAEKQNLPAGMTESWPIAMTSIFRKFAVSQAYGLEQLLRTKPQAVIPLIAANALLGEITGDTKKGIQGALTAAITGDPNDMTKKLEEHLGQSWPTIIAEDFANSFALGLLSGTVNAAAKGDVGGFMREVGGVGWGDIFTGATALAQTGKGIYNVTAEGTDKGEFKKAGKNALRLMPIVGNDLARAVK